MTKRDLQERLMRLQNKLFVIDNTPFSTFDETEVIKTEISEVARMIIFYDEIYNQGTIERA